MSEDNNLEISCEDLNDSNSTITSNNNLEVKVKREVDNEVKTVVVRLEEIRLRRGEGSKQHQTLKKEAYDLNHDEANNNEEEEEKDEGVVSYECTECNFSTNVRKKILIHFNRHHLNKREFKCDLCERTFKELALLNLHKNQHLGIKPHQCQSCEKYFSTLSELLRHIQYNHTNEKPFKCEICDYSSVEKNKLERHMRVHTDERPYLCPYCDYGAKDTFRLKRHIRIHTGEKPYECPFCSKAFSQSNTLKTHMKTFHPDEKIEPKKAITSEGNRKSDELNGSTWHSCSECTMKFASGELLAEHLGKHAGNRPYACEQCGMTFTQKFTLRSHVLSHDADYAEKLKQKLKTINETTKKAGKRSCQDDLEMEDEEENNSKKRPRISNEKHRCNFCPSNFISENYFISQCCTDDANLKRHIEKKHCESEKKLGKIHLFFKSQTPQKQSESQVEDSLNASDDATTDKTTTTTTSSSLN